MGNGQESFLCLVNFPIRSCPEESFPKWKPALTFLVKVTKRTSLFTISTQAFYIFDLYFNTAYAADTTFIAIHTFLNIHNNNNNPYLNC